MGHDHDGQTSHEVRARRRLHIKYSRKMHERQIFMDELKEIRDKQNRRRFKELKTLIGPIWYQALSVLQRGALDTLADCIYKDLLENRPLRTLEVVKKLGIYPRPHQRDLMECIERGRDDAKESLSYMFLISFGHPIDMKRTTYNLNARLMLTGIYYLSANDMINALRVIFRPDKQEPAPVKKKKPRARKPLASPYLQDMVAILYEPKRKKAPPPPPLPNLDKLNEEPLFEELEYKPPVVPVPPPPPKKRVPRGLCDQMAGYHKLQPYTPAQNNEGPGKAGSHWFKRSRRSKASVNIVKKVYGIGITRQTNSKRFKKITAPSTGLPNAKYNICGVQTVRGRNVLILGSVCILPPDGELIHGGMTCIKGLTVNIHLGYQGRKPPPRPLPCDCMKRYQDVVFDYVHKTKCYCGHYYDYFNEGTFSPDELPFFHKPTRHSPAIFNYENIFNLDEKKITIDKEFKRIWETESMLRVHDPDAKVEPKIKKKKIEGSACLPDDPKPEDYLKCAIRTLKPYILGARLPDVHLAPELKEWMRFRIYGPFKPEAKTKMLVRSVNQWAALRTWEMKGLGHVGTEEVPMFKGNSNWLHKKSLNNSFKIYSNNYRLRLYRSLAYVTNLMWPTMCQEQFPDKKFREIFFSYLYPRMEDLQLLHPFDRVETSERCEKVIKGRVVCIPKGAENVGEGI